MELIHSILEYQEKEIEWEIQVKEELEFIEAMMSEAHSVEVDIGKDSVNDVYKLYITASELHSDLLEVLEFSIVQDSHVHTAGSKLCIICTLDFSPSTVAQTLYSGNTHE